MWRNRTPFLKGRVLKNGRPARATVRFALRGTDSEGNATWKELRGELEVAMPGGDVVVLRGLFNGDRKRSPFVLPGMQVPVKLHADDDQKLVIYWDAWEDEGGLAQAKAQGGEGEAAKANATVHAGTPVDSAPPSQMMSAGEAAPAAGGWQAQTIKAWQDAVAAGAMSQEDYEKAIADLRAAGG
jgi:hypothetical protein